MQTEDGWGDAFAACYLLNQGLQMERTGEQQSTHALQRCNDARIAEAKGEWSEAAALWEAALAKMCTPAVLRGVEGVDKSSMLCAHLMAAILDRRDACAYGPHPARLRASRA
jgi:hypothetical protein